MNLFACLCVRQRKIPAVTAQAGDISFGEKGSQEALVVTENQTVNPIYKTDSLKSTPEKCQGFVDDTAEKEAPVGFEGFPEAMQPVMKDIDEVDSKSSDTTSRPSSLEAEALLSTSATTAAPSIPSSPSRQPSSDEINDTVLSPRESRVIAMREARERRKTIEESVVLETLAILDSFLDE